MAAPDQSSIAARDGDKSIHHRLALPALFLGAVGISFSAIFVRLSEVGPSPTAFWRVLLCLPVLWLFLFLENRRRGRRQIPQGTGNWARLGLVGFLFAADLAFWHWSINSTTVANATLFANFAPIFVTIGSFLIFKERFTRIFLLGLILAIFGAIALMGQSVTLDSRYLLGDILGLVTAFFYGSYQLTVGRVRARFSTLSLMVWSGWITAILLLPVALVEGGPLMPASIHGWAVLFGLSFISQAAGQSLITYAFAWLSPAFASISLVMQPALSALLAWIILSESMFAGQMLAALIILAGITLAHRGRNQRTT